MVAAKSSIRKVATFPFFLYKTELEHRGGSKEGLREEKNEGAVCLWKEMLGTAPSLGHDDWLFVLPS